MKKYLVALGGLATSVAALAEEGASVTINDAGALEGIKTALLDWVSNAMPVVVAIIGAFMAFWLVKFVIRVVKGIASKSA